MQLSQVIHELSPGKAVTQMLPDQTAAPLLEDRIAGLARPEQAAIHRLAWRGKIAAETFIDTLILPSLDTRGLPALPRRRCMGSTDIAETCLLSRRNGRNAGSAGAGAPGLALA
jgi:hypothetical protein